MAKVAPETEPPNATQWFERPFKKPVPSSPPLGEYDPTYVKRKKEVGEKFFTCKSGRKFAYFTDGAPDPNCEGVSILFCHHSCGQSKYMWLMKEPFKNIFQVSVDRFGFGHSSDAPTDGYWFDQLVPEMVELVDAIYDEYKIPKEKKFFVTGHSMGATVAIEMAACPELRDRIEAIAPISGPADIWNSRVTKAERNGACMSFMRNSEKTGCCSGGSLSRWTLDKIGGMSLSVMRPYPKEGEDDRHAQIYKEYFCGQDGGGSKQAQEAAYGDPFLLSLVLDSMMPGPHNKYHFINEFRRALGAEWAYDPGEIKCPCFIYNGMKEETPAKMAHIHNKLIPGSELTLWPYGHASIFFEFERIIQALVKKQKVDGDPLCAC